MGTLSEDNPQGVKILVVSYIFTATAIVAVALRLWSRKLKRAEFYLHDYAIIVALLLSLTLVALVTAAIVATGLGQHIYELTSDQIVTFIKLYIAVSVTWITAITVVKVSILDLYIKIFRIGWFIKTCYVFIVIQILFFITVILEMFLYCRPLNFEWDPTVKGTCGDKAQFYLSQHVTILILDFAIGVLPTPVLWGLKMPWSKKIGISLLFGIGVVICVISGLRIGFLNHVDDPDVTYDWALLYLFTILEPLLGILLACLPMISPVTSKITSSYLYNWSKERVLIAWSSSRTSRFGQSSGSSTVPRAGHKLNFHLLPERHFTAESDTKIQTGSDIHALGDLEAQDLIPGNQVYYPKNIHVTTAWNIQSTTGD